MLKKIRSCFCFWPFSLLVSVILSAAPFLFMKIYYMYGDDYLMNYIANGSFGIAESDHLIFPRMLFGTITKFLYGITTSVNWYCVLLVATIAVSYSIVHWVIARVSANPFALMISIIINAVTVPMVLTFTTSAFLAVAAGAVLLYYAAYSDRRASLMTALGCALILWGYAIRNDALVPGLIMLGPVALKFFIDWLTSRDDKRKMLTMNIIRLVIGAVVSVICLYGMRLWELNAYGTKEWLSFRAYNVARSSALDYPGVNYQHLQEAFETIDFTEEEYELMYRWSFGEKDAFSEEKFARIGMIIQNAFSTGYRKDYTKLHLTQFPNYLTMVIPAIVWLLLALSDKKFKRLIALLEVLGLSAVLVALCFLRLRFLLRVSIPLSMIAVIGMLLLTEAPPKGKGLAAAFLMSAVSILMFGWFMKGFNESVRLLRNPYNTASSEAALEEIHNHPEKLYVVDSSAYARMYYYGHPVSEIHTIEDFKHVFRSGSWDTFSTRYYNLIREFDFADPDNLISTLLDCEDAYLISDSPGYYRRYLEQKTGGKIKAIKETLAEGPYELCQFVTKK